LVNAGIALESASDHGVSEALYLRDLDGNGVELYWDRPRERWPRTPEGGIAMFTRALDLDSLLSAFGGKLPYKVKASSPTGQAMVADANVLNSYNNGQLTDRKSVV
jgi:catechol-2,3-dioxygenase